MLKVEPRPLNKWKEARLRFRAPRKATDALRRGSAESAPFEYDYKPLPITISLGVTITAGNESLTPLEFIGRADERLYEAKHRGRNRVVA